MTSKQGIRLVKRSSGFKGVLHLKKLSLMLLVTLTLSLTVFGQAVAQTEPQTPTEICDAAMPAADPETRDFSQAEQVLEADVDYQAIFCTSAGPVYIDLFEKDAPITVNNFVFLANNGYYNNTTFHRVIKDFMAQGGDPTATGSGGPDYQFEDEFVPALRFDQPGRLAMANAGPGTNGSQFFITTVPTPHLNDLHTIFGQVIEGQANVVSINERDPATATEPGTALNTVVIITDPSTVAVTEKTLSTQEETVTAMDNVDAIITDDVVNVLENQKASFTSEELVSGAPAEMQSALGDFLTAHNHQYRVSSIINNKACDLNTVQFISLGYTLDSFASAADAAAALADEALAQLPMLNGFTDTTTSEYAQYPVFTANVTACDQPAIHAMTYWQRGNFIATAEVTIPAADNAEQDLGRILVQFVGQQVYEPLVSSVLFKGIQ